MNKKAHKSMITKMKTFPKTGQINPASLKLETTKILHNKIQNEDKLKHKPSMLNQELKISKTSNK